MLSLVFWALMIIVSLKYVVFVMRANNDGEGGILALVALVMRAAMRSTEASSASSRSASSAPRCSTATA